MRELMTPGEKIKMHRTQLGLTQDDIIDETISKTLISMIEQDKRSLTERTAKVIADRLNEQYEKLGQTGQKITPEYLMESVKDQMKEEIIENIESLQKAIKHGGADENLIIHTFDRTISLINKGGFKGEEIEIRILRGNYYFDNFQYKKAIADYLDALDYAIGASDYGQVARLYISLGVTYQMLLMIDPALVHYTKAYQMASLHNTENRDKIRVQAVFNEILCYRSMKRYEWVLPKIALLRHLKWDNPLFKKILKKVDLIEANTFRDLENWEKADVIYQRLLAEKKRLDSESLFLLYENYGVYYRNKGDNKNALEYLNKALSLREKVDLYYIPPLYLYQATCYNLREEYEKVNTLLENALSLAEKVSRKEKIIEVRFAFVEVSMELGDYESALQHLSIVDEPIHETNIHSLLHTLYSFYINCYNGMGDTAKVAEYANKIRPKNYYRD